MLLQIAFGALKNLAFHIRVYLGRRNDHELIEIGRFAVREVLVGCFDLSGGCSCCFGVDLAPLLLVVLALLVWLASRDRICFSSSCCEMKISSADGVLIEPLFGVAAVVEMREVCGNQGVVAVVGMPHGFVNMQGFRQADFCCLCDLRFWDFAPRPASDQSVPHESAAGLCLGPVNSGGRTHVRIGQREDKQKGQCADHAREVEPPAGWTNGQVW